MWFLFCTLTVGENAEGISLLERLINDEIRRVAGLVQITEVIRESRLNGRKTC